MMSNKPKKTKPAAKGKVDSSLELLQLKNKVDGLSQLIVSLSGQLQQAQNQMNVNWTRFVFHDHRRVDLSGPQFFNQDYEKQFMLQQKAQAEAQAKARGEQEPPKPAAPAKAATPAKAADSPASEK